MRLWLRIRSWLRFLFARSRAESEMASELEFHIAEYAEDLARGGLSPEAALRRARLAFGGAERVKEECREARGLPSLETLIQDLRYGLRTLRKTPGFAIVAVLTLGLGAGAATAVFSILEGVLLKPLPYPESEQLVSVEVTPLALDRSARGMAPEDYFIFREQGETFQNIGVYAETDTDRDVNITGFGHPERVHALHVSDGVLPVLGIRPMLGRIFSRLDDSPGAPLTAILTATYWHRRFGANPAVLGKPIVVDGKPRQIVGVLPEDFRFLDASELALILPLQLDRNSVQLGNFSYFGIARLKPGVTLNQASADVARMLPAVLNAFPPPQGFSLDSFKAARIAPSLSPLKQDVVGNISTLLWVVMGAVAVVLLIACANVANLLLVRTEARRHELALRSALGAGRRRIAALLLSENAILGLAGSGLGLALAWSALRVVLAAAPPGLPRLRDIRIDLPVLLFTVTIALLTTLLVGLLPVLKHSTARAALTASPRNLSESRERHRARNSLVTLQVALAFVLLICSGLMIRTFRSLTQVDPGFKAPAELQLFRISIPASDVPEDNRVTRIEQQIQEKLAAIPGVSSAAFASAVPLDSDNMLDNIFAADRTYAREEIPPLRHLVFMSPEYLRTLGVRLVAGRDVSWADIYNRVPVAVISENFAREYWRTPAQALGKQIRIFAVDDWRQIVGVAGDVNDNGIDKPPRPTVYWPAFTANFQGQPRHVTRSATFLVRSPLAGSQTLIGAIRHAVWTVDANAPLANIYTLQHFYRASMARASFTLVVLGIAGTMALLLGGVGLYGVIAYSVSQRTREIGIRMALGSSQTDVLKAVVAEGMSLIAIGFAAGLAASLSSTRLLSSLLFGVSPTDPLTYAGVMTLLALVALAACYIPARRAVTIEPLSALRHE